MTCAGCAIEKRETAAAERQPGQALPALAARLVEHTPGLPERADRATDRVADVREPRAAGHEREHGEAAGAEVAGLGAIAADEALVGEHVAEQRAHLLAARRARGHVAGEHRVALEEADAGAPEALRQQLGEGVVVALAVDERAHVLAGLDDRSRRHPVDAVVVDPDVVGEVAAERALHERELAEPRASRRVGRRDRGDDPALRVDREEEVARHLVELRVQPLQVLAEPRRELLVHDGGIAPGARAAQRGPDVPVGGDRRDGVEARARVELERLLDLEAIADEVVDGGGPILIVDEARRDERRRDTDHRGDGQEERPEAGEDHWPAPPAAAPMSKGSMVSSRSSTTTPSCVCTTSAPWKTFSV
ncbi:MAG: hypothetical protein KC619_02090 [Myxococcales bacterium]|nr:hypothetical protein [Myxococcales bacterium]